ncbi:MAG: efflux RND transporter periplasmic adaptor subunit [Hyphomicrobiaceae bacterium]|nr:MAG: efflux RND transporter periplasmic adaptor subunit [Hyphomicrobiaceae bacterium]KAB2851809.1 MAG: efflux RND transporter periplasmic adaptor subunit [Hyphomicrobiaceae bacterium]
MKARRLVAYIAGAVATAAVAYFVWPGLIGGPREQVPAKKADGKAQLAGAAPVRAATVIEGDMPVILTAPGTVEPLANVAVKTRVDGQIVEVRFKEGDLVNEGDILFKLDDRLVKAQIAQAEANIAKDQASLKVAESILSRRETLARQKIVSEEAAETAKQTVEGLRAAIAAGQALLESQKTQLDYLTIRAPITGRTGSLNAKIGATVRSADALALVTINQTRPITVSFAIPQAELAALRRALAASATADVAVPGGTRPTVVKGTITFVDNQVDRTTGTITAKVVADNADEVLWPGQSVAVRLTVEIKPRMLSVPAPAVLPAQQGMIAWVIGPDNKVAPRTVTVERIVDQTAFLSAGLNVGERVVTDGQIRLSPGATVTIEEPRRGPSPATEERRMNGRG